MPRAVAPPKPKLNWRLWLRLTAWAAVAAGLAFGAREVDGFLLSDPRFGMQTLEFRGITYASRARLRAVFDPDFGRSVFEIPLAERRRHLLAVDWVSTASISRIWPNRLIVTIHERTPAAFAKLQMGGTNRYRFGLIDTDGVLLSLPPHVRFHLPVLAGVTETQTEADRKVRVSAMLHLLDDMGPQAKDISEVNVVSPEDLRVITTVQGRAVELWVGDQHYRARYQTFLSHYPEIHAHSEDSAIFDLRMDDRISAR
jgi:cell division septal protein FtsQ